MTDIRHAAAAVSLTDGTRPAGDDWFRVAVAPDRDLVHVRPIGELDMATVGELERELDALLQRGFRRVILDLRGVGFIDSSGMHLALRWAQRAADDGIELRYVAGPPAVRRVFELTGVAGRLPFVDPDPRWPPFS